MGHECQRFACTNTPPPFSSVLAQCTLDTFVLVHYGGPTPSDIDFGMRSRYFNNAIFMEFLIYENTRYDGKHEYTCGKRPCAL